MKPGGVLLMNVPFHYWIHEAPHDYYRYTEFALRRMLEESGFEMLEMRSIGGALEVITDFLGKFLARGRRGKYGGLRLAVWVQDMVTFWRKSTFCQNHTDGAFTLGYCVVARKHDH